MKRIISTLLSLSLVLSLLPAVALAEGESSGVKIEAADSLFVGQSTYVSVGDENGLVMEHVDWTATPDSIVQLDEVTDADMPTSQNLSAHVKVTAKQAGTVEIKAITGSGRMDTHMITVEPLVPVEKITLDSEMTFTTSGLHELEYTIEPANASIQDLEWESTDEAVAKVQYSSGRYVLYAYKNGTTTITATVTDGSGVTASCEVTVNINYPVQGISLNHDAKTFTKAGETLQLTATIYPDSATNKTVTWKSSDEKVATVDESGLVTAVGNGTADITATTEDGNFKATCQVTVEIPELTLSLDKSELTLTQTEEQQKLTATVSDTEEKVTWLSSDPFVATVTRDGTVTAIANGTATITASAGDKTVSCTVEVALTDTPAHTHVWSKSWDANVFYHYRRCQNRETCNVTS